MTNEVEDHGSGELCLDWTSASAAAGAAGGKANRPCPPERGDRPPAQDAAPSGRVVPFRPRPREQPTDPWPEVLDADGRLDAGLAVRRLGAELPAVVGPVLEAVAEVIRSSTVAAEDIVRLLNRAVGHGIDPAGRVAISTIEMAEVAAVSHLGAGHDLSSSARANLVLAHRLAGRTGDTATCRQRQPGGARRSKPRPGTRVATFSGRVLTPHGVCVATATAGTALSACMDGGRVDLDVVPQLLGDDVAPPTRALLLALVEEARSSASAVEELMALLNHAIRHLLDVSGEVDAAACPVELAVAAAASRLGAGHRETTTARANLASSYLAAGRTGDAIRTFAEVVADRERLLGAGHPDTITARAGLAAAYHRAGRLDEAVDAFAAVAADLTQVLGPEHPETLCAQGDLAAAYASVGRLAKALALFERVAADRSRLLGAHHPDTISARAELAAAYSSVGRRAEALALFESVVVDRSRVLGPEHPDTLTARFDLATFYQATGRTAQALMAFERVLADRQRLLGVAHPSTVSARARLAAASRSAGRTGQALTLFEQVVADRARLLGPDHPKTLTARATLAACYQEAGRTPEALALLERVVADRARLLGAGHPKTLTARANLAMAYASTGRRAKAQAILRSVASDCERLLGPAHPQTAAARARLAGLAEREGGT